MGICPGARWGGVGRKRGVFGRENTPLLCLKAQRCKRRQEGSKTRGEGTLARSQGGRQPQRKRFQPAAGTRVAGTSQQKQNRPIKPTSFLQGCPQQFSEDQEGESANCRATDRGGLAWAGGRAEPGQRLAVIPFGRCSAACPVTDVSGPGGFHLKQSENRFLASLFKKTAKSGPGPSLQSPYKYGLSTCSVPSALPGPKDTTVGWGRGSWMSGSLRSNGENNE